MRPVKLQGAKTNQGETSALTIMEHSIRKEAAELLCDAVQCRINDGEAPDDVWKDSKGMPIPPNHLCPESSGEAHHHHDEDGPCMGIEVNIWERAKAR